MKLKREGLRSYHLHLAMMMWAKALQEIVPFRMVAWELGTSVVASLQKAEREAAAETLLLLAAQQAAAPVGASSGHMAALQEVTAAGVS
jgi:hypothetical protein